MKPLIFHGHFSQPVQAIFWMLSSGFFFSCLNAEIRYLSEFLHPFETAFFRNFFGLAFMLPWLFRTGLSGLRTNRLKLYVFRTTLGLISMLCWFTALGMLPLSQAVALSFTAPLFATMGAALFLHEKVRGRRWAATIIGFAGVLIIARPEAVGISLGVALAIGSSVLSAAITLIVKRLSRTESSSAIVTYMVLIMTPMSLVPALFVWQWPALNVWPYLVATGMFGTAGHLCWVRAFRMADASAVLPFDYGRMLFAAIIGYFAFNEIPDGYTWIGSGIIAAASSYIARREAILNRREAAIAATRIADAPAVAGR
jgi:drug/metabolite transporter (DMT)-like permease